MHYFVSILCAEYETMILLVWGFELCTGLLLLMRRSGECTCAVLLDLGGRGLTSIDTLAKPLEMDTSGMYCWIEINESS